MKKLVKRFNDDPAFALAVIAVTVPLGIALLNAVAKNVEAGAYAYRASKM